MAYKAPPLAPWAGPSNWEVETGARLWLSTGSIGAPNPLLNVPGNVLASRLLYKDEDAYSGEVFARVDHASGFFVKGNLGAGGITGGKMFDEDFPAAGAYSNTLQNNNAGSIGYGTIDVGYSVFKTPDAKFGPFVGYNYYRQQVSTFNCTQLAGAATCTPTTPFPPGLLGINEDDHFNSVRLGLSGQFMLTDRLRLTADAAYLPWINFNGQDDHNARQLLLPETAPNGDGVMLEAALDYKVTDAWNVGIGGRYWAWNTNTGSTNFNFLGFGTLFVEPVRYTTERYGMFLQTSYHFGDTRPLDAPMPVKAPVSVRAPMYWTGPYVGAHLGGGWGNDHWSDPFGDDFILPPGAPTVVNVAGFGDSIHATGPLGGGQIGFNLQTGAWVIGAEADASAAHLRGENTCFTGLGGVDCMRSVDALGTVTVRGGYAWNRALAYVKGGGAWTSTTYSLNANTNTLALGTGSTSSTVWGWTVGGGVEYGLTNNWTALVEYDHIEIPSTTVAFPTVAVINAQSISVRQGIDMVKLGLNYKFDVAALGAIFARH
jgi:opacity protein-like surface antigen